jgi:VCBS repeat-containing protein
LAGKFNEMTPDGQGAHPGAHVQVGTVSGHAPADAIVIPDAHLLFTGDFKRAGVDLVVSGDGHEIVLHDYFKGEKRAALASPDGAHLTGDIINALTGHIQFAQADGSASVAQVIGHVTKLTGTATAIRNGVAIILNQGDNVNKGDVVASGSDSTLGITFIDGSVFGLASNARMVLNEMIYDPNGSDNKSLISLVAGTISFVAGATAKHGDMKVDTPVATMGIRGTAVLVEIDFEVSVQGGAPPAKFQVLVEPDGTTGSYILFDKTTLTPIATVNQAGTATIVNGQGTVNFLSSAQLSADAQKIITDVFALKFSDLNNPNTKTATNFTDSITQQNITVKTASGEDVAVKVLTVNVADKAADPTKSANPSSRDHIPGPPTVITHDGATTERALTTGSAAIDSVTGTVAYADINPGDVPTVKTAFTSYTYQNAALTDVTATLTAAQLAAIKAVEAPLTVVQDPTNINFGTANWTYNVADGAFDFLAAGEVLTLTYTAHVDNNFAANNESKEVTFTITITGTNDAPVITTGPQHISFAGGKTTPGPFLTTSDATSGTLSFTDVDLTDTHTVSTKLTSALLSGAQITTLAPAPLKFFETALTASIAAGNDSTQQNTGTINWSLADLRAYLADFVPAGDTLTLVYTVTVTDSQGATSTQDITVTITGNNTPAVVWVATTQSGSTGDWNDASNWETGNVPTATDDAIIITNQLQQLTPFYPVTINAAAFAKSVTMNDFGTTPPELDNNSTLQIGGAFNLFADSIVKNTGTINVGGVIEVQGTSQLTNSGALNLAQGGDFKDSSSITNSGTLDVTGGALNVLVNVANASGALKVEHGAALNLKSANINGGTVSNAGTLDNVSGNNVISGLVANTGTIEVVSGTLNLSGGLIGAGTLIVDGGTTLELAGADAQTVTFAGGTAILQLDNSLGFTGTISGVSSSAGAFTVTGAGNVTSGSGDAIDFTASGGVAGNPAAITVTPSGTITGAAGGIKVIQNGVGDISVNATGDVAGLAGNGIVAQDSATGTGNIVVHSTGSVTGTGSGSVGVVAVNLNAANSGNVKVTELGGVSGGGFGIDAETHGNGDVSVEAAGSVTAGVQYGIVAKSFGAGDLSVVTDAETTINSGGTGIIVLNRDTAIDASANSTVTVTANGTINSGTTVNLGGSTPSGIAAGYTGIGGFGAVANTSVNGTVVVNNYANITAAAGYGIDTYNYGNGDVTVNDKAETSVTGAQYGIAAYGLSGGTGNVTVNVEANATITGTSLDGIHAFNYDNGNVTVATSSNDAINAGNIGINAVNRSAVVSAGSSVAVTANGTINAGSEGIVAGYDRGTNSVAANVAGDVTVNSSATIVATGFNGIVALNWGTGDATVTSTGSVTAGFVGIEADAFGGGDVTVTNSGTVISTGTASGGGIRAEAANGGNVSVTNDGSVSGATAIWVGATGASDVSVTNNSQVTGTGFTGIDVYSANSTGPTTITNNSTVSGPTGISVNASGAGDVVVVNSLNGQVTGTTGSGIYVSQVDANPIAATGSTTITNSGTVLGSATAAAIAIQENAIGTATIVNHGTIGPGVVTASTQAVSESGGDISINNDGFLYGTLNLANGTLNNTGTWQVGGSSGFGFASSTGVATAFAINNTGGAIDLIGSAHLYGANGLDISNSGTIEGVSGLNTVSGAAITNSGAGTVKVDAAAIAGANTLKLDNGSRITSGTLTIGALSVLEIEGLNLLGVALDHVGISGAGLIDVGTASAATLTLTNGAHTDNVAVTVESGSTLALDGSTLNGGTITISGELDSTGSSFISGATVNNGLIGTIKVASGSTLEIDSAAVINGGSLVNAGTVQLETSTGATLNGVAISGGGAINVDDVAQAAAIVLEGGTSITDGTLVNGKVGMIEVEGAKGATFDHVQVTNDGLLQIDGASLLVLQNGATIGGSGDITVASGALLQTYGAGIEINAAITNDGTIEIKDGALKISTSISGAGSVRIDGGAAFELNGSDSQTVEFHGDNAVFKIDGASFGGSIVGFAATDEIDLQSIAYDATTTATFVANADNSGGVLTFFHGTDSSIAMTLVGDYIHAHLAGAGDATHTLITFNAVDDAPVFAEKSETGSTDEQLATTGSSALDSAGGTLHFTDIDLLDRPTATITSQSVTWTAADHHTDLGSPSQLTAIENALTLTQSGNTNNGAIGWNYSIADGVLDFLAEGETITLTSTVTLNDGEGKTDTATVIVTIIGHNDAPAITVDSPAAVTEGDTGTLAPVAVAVADHVAITDVDTTDVHTPYVTNTLAFDAADSTGPAPLGGSLSDLFTIDPVKGTVSYDEAAFDYLAGGEQVVATFTFDASSEPDTLHKTIAITINGENDAPTVTVDNPAAVTEGDTGTPDPVIVAVADHVTIKDVDASDVHTLYVAGTLAFDDLDSTGPAPSGGSLSDLFTIDPVTGTVSYDKAAFDYLAGGEQVVATFTFDASSGPDTLHKTIAITVNGENDAPTITVDNPAAVTEGDTGTPDPVIVAVADHVSITDVDKSDVHTLYVAGTLAFDTADSTGPAPVGGPLSDLFTIDPVTGTVSYDKAAFDYLAGDEHVVATFTFDASSGPDVLHKTITLTINGINDAPVFTGDAVGTAYAANGGAVAIAIHVAASDVDSANYNDGTLTATVIAGGQQGDTLSIASGDFISVRGNEIWFDADGDGDDDAVDIGALTNNGINSLTITLNSGADDAAVAALTQAIEFSNSKPDPVAGTRTVAFTLHDGGGIADGGHDSAYFTANVDVTAATAPEFQLLDASFLGGASDQAATAVTYNGGHLYLTYNAPITSSASDHSTVVGFTTGSGAPTQDFSESWSCGFFNGVAADANTIYAAGGSHPSAGLTHDGVGGEEEKSILVGFNANGTAGSHPAPATEYAANNFFSYTGTEMFQGVLATTQGGNTILYATGFGQPASYGAYVLAEYNSAGTLLHSATDPQQVPGFSNAYTAVEFNGAIWAVGNTQHSGDVTNTATVWTASYDLSSVVTHKDVTGSAAGNFTGAAVIGNALYAVGGVNSNGGDFLIAKYNTDGSVAWSESFGGSGADTLNGAVALDGHLYVVGSTTSGGSTDGVLMEINTADGSVVSSTTYGGALYDSFNAITTDGHNLYVAGESKSFTNGGNGVGQDDAILLTYSSGHGTPAPGSSGPVIDTDQFSITENGGGVTTVSGLHVADTDATAATDTFTLTTTTGASPESSAAPTSGSGSLAAINTTLSNGVVYDPGVVQPQTDSVTFTVADSFGGHDTVHFIFNQGGTGPDITLTGTSGKDVIFATGNNDTLTGGAGADQFVFRPSGNANSDTITDFSPGLDHIDLRAFASTVNTNNIAQWLTTHAVQSQTNPADAVITLDANDSITLKNVVAAHLSANDFILHTT